MKDNDRRFKKNRDKEKTMPPATQDFINSINSTPDTQQPVPEPRKGILDVPTFDEDGIQTSGDSTPFDSPTQLAPQQRQDATITHVLTDAESNLLIHAHTGEVDWVAAVEALDDYELMKDPFEIPPECAVRQEKKEFRYRWLNPKDRERFDMQTSGTLRWWVCNRTNAPEIPDRYRDSNGLVRRSGLVLAKMPYAMYMKRQTMVWALAAPPERKGPTNHEGYEYMDASRAKFRSGDVIHAEERVSHRIDPRTGAMQEQSRVEFYKEGRRYTGDSADVVEA